jgi:acyl carrier protein
MKYMDQNLLYKNLSILLDVEKNKLKSNLTFQSLKNWDSLKFMELVIFIEKYNKKKLSSKQIQKIKKISDVEKILC